MDLIYIVNKKLSKCDNFELRWSLRSIDQFAKGIDNIYIIGDVPEFVNSEYITIINYEHTPENDCYKKAINNSKMLKYVLDNYEISDEFIVSYDDHYLIKETDFNNYPIYCKQTKSDDIYVYNKLDEEKGYYGFMKNTYKFLIDNNLPVFNFAPHKNFKLNKEIVLDCFNEFEELETVGIEPFVLFLNYQYNIEKIEYKVVNDVKIDMFNFTQQLKEEDRQSISTNDLVPYCKLFELMNNLFPNKSKYEL